MDREAHEGTEGKKRREKKGDEREGKDPWSSDNSQQPEC